MKKSILLYALFVSLTTINKVIAQNADVTVNGSVTTNGSWSGGTTGPYVFTPNANAATVLNTDIINRLTGGAGFTINDVTITTACGSCTDQGNITINTIISAANSGSPTPNFSVTAANNISVTATIDLTAATGATGTNNGGSSNAITGGTGGLGGNGINISLSTSNPSGSITLSNNAFIITSGGDGGTGGSGGDLGGNGGDGGTGGNAGSITLSSQGSCIINSGSSLVANGGNGGTSGVAGGGTAGTTGVTGNANNISITGIGGISIAGDLTALGTANGNFTINDGNLIVTTGGTNDGQTAGVIAGGNLTKNGNGTFFIGGDNTYTGTTTINAGTLRPTNNTVMANTNGPLGNNASGLFLNGGTIESNVAIFTRPISITATGSRIDAYGTGRTISSTITQTSAGTFNLNVGGTTASSAEGQLLTLSGVITNSFGTLSLTKTGTSEVALSAINTFDGGVTVSTGTLDINNTDALGNITGTFTIDSAATINNTSGSPITASNYPMVWNGDFTFAGTNALDLGTGAITMNSNIIITTTTNSLTIGGTINDATKNFTKAGPGQLSFGNQAIALNNFTNSAGTIILTTGNLSVAGNFINNDIITNGGGNVLFNGTAAQTIGGSKPTTFNNLTINNTYTTPPQITLTNNETVSGTLTLTQGNIDGQTNSDTVFVSNTATAAISRSGGYIIGNLARSIINTGSPAYTYYIGTTTAYTPVSITLNSLSTGGFITGSATGGDNPNICSSAINPGLTVNDHWTFTNSGVIFTNYSVTFSYPPADLDAGVTAANFGLGKYNGTWNYPTVNGIPTTSITSISNETTFGSFAIGDTVTNKISYSGGSFCTTISSPQPVTITGAQGGAFSSSAGLTLNPVTGAITPSTSTPASYTVTYTIPAAVCPAYLATTTVTINATPTASISVNSPGLTVLDCNHTEIYVTASGGASYIWSGGNNTAIATNFFSAPNTYSVTVTGSNGCQSVGSIVITQDTITPIAGITISNTGGTTILDCNNPIIYAAATGTGIYSWSGGDSLSTSKNNSFSQPDSYSLTVTGSNGCKSTANVTITEDTTTPTAGITNNTGTTILDCLNPVIHVTATGGSTYEWQGGDSVSNSVTNSFTTPNLYFVKVIGNNGCSIYDSILITQNVAGIVYNTNALTCITNTVGVRATGGVTYSWSGGNTPATDTNTFSAPGTYTVTVTASNGCISSDSITIIIDTIPLKISTSLGTTVLDCKNSYIDVSANRGYSFAWSGGSTPTSDVNEFTSPGNYTLTAIIGNGCNNTAVISITLDTLKPTASITCTVSPVIGCTNNSITVSATGGVNYLWTGGTSSATNINSFTATGIYTVTVTGSNSCSDTASIAITKDTVAPIIIINNITGTNGLTCSTTSVSIIATGASTYAWTGGTSPTSANNSFIGAGTYSLTATGTNGCASDTSITITQNITTPTVSILNNSGTYTLTCAANQIIVTASGANSYSWSGGNSTATAIDTLTALGTYTVTGTGTNGCSSNANITIYQAAPVPPPITIINHTGTTLLCNQHQFIDVTATGGGGTSYSWSGGNSPLAANNTFTTAGTYTVTSLASGGCGGATATIQITQLSAAVSLTEGDDTSCIGQYPSFSFDATPNNAGINPSYQWRVNGNSVGTNSATYTSSTIHSGDVVDVIVTSTTMSVTTISNAIAMVVNPLPPKPIITLTANSFMSSAASGNQWYLNGILINGAISQSYPVTQAGFYAVEVTDKGCKTTSDITLGVDTYIASNTITIYPNPFALQTTVLFDKEVKNATIKVVSLSGATIRETTCSGKQATIDRDELEAGVYFIQVITDGEMIAHEKVIIQ